jgi:hypothetical protein
MKIKSCARIEGDESTQASPETIKWSKLNFIAFAKVAHCYNTLCNLAAL